MKAMGIPLTDNHDNCFGICIDENAKYLGTWTSSNYSWLEKDLSKHAEGYEYVFLKKPGYQELVSIILNVLNNPTTKHKETL